LLSSRLLEQVFRTVEALPPASVKNAAAVLEAAGGTPPKELTDRVLGSVALPQERAVLNALLAEWGREVATTSPAPQLVSVALRSALHTKAAMDGARQVELAWTGPASGMTFRRTDQALLQVIQEARHDLLLVTFAAYRVPLLQDAIRQAIGRGVQVSFLGESAHESGGKVSFDAAQALGAVAEQIRFYVWPREKRETDAAGNTGSLHAKCAAADGELLFVSSANFTEHALLLNMEMGVLIRGGGIPAQVRDHFRRLVDRGHIVPI
jgi:phosphatidylserine/phosphatidylglycerophosphate/cardiolipin synthase-like enzyme